MDGLGWSHWEAPNGIVHIMPERDSREHIFNTECWCKPSLEDIDDRKCYVHNSTDRREDYEDNVRQLN